MAKRVLWALSSAHIALVGCSPSTEDLPTEPPTSVTKVTSGGFSSPSDVVASPDGSTFYFAAYNDQKQPTIFKTSSETGSSAEPLHTGYPLGAPMGLVLSCDGGTLFVADLAASDPDGNFSGDILAMSTAGGRMSRLGVAGLARPSGLAMHPDCKTVYITGRTDDGQPALLSMSTGGGSASVVYAGEPLVAPTGLHVDTDGVAWVMDHLADGAGGAGVLWAIPSDGSAATEVASGLRMGTPGGVSLTAGGGTAVMPTRDADGVGQLTTVNIATGETIQVPAPDIVDPAGLRTARKAGVFAIVDSEASTIYKAQ
jgi:DNA-binding beta-propeller fold protein YncE